MNDTHFITNTDRIDSTTITETIIKRLAKARRFNYFFVICSRVGISQRPHKINLLCGAGRSILPYCVYNHINHSFLCENCD